MTYKMISVIAPSLIIFLHSSYAANSDSAIETVKSFLHSKNNETVEKQLDRLDSAIIWHTADNQQLKGNKEVRPFLQYLMNQETMDQLIKIHQNKDGSVSLTRNVCLKKFPLTTCPRTEIDHVVVKDGKITQWTAHFTKTNGAK